jgi:putative PIN family toxin of toxin-antitoxin system
LRAVLDPNVLISALLAPEGAPATLIRRWLDGAFDLTVSETLLTELRRALAYPKLSRHVTREEADAFVELLRRAAIMAPDISPPPPVSRDPGDDYLVELARSTSAILVTGDRDLLSFKDAPVTSPRSFLSMVTR